MPTLLEIEEHLIRIESKNRLLEEQAMKIINNMYLLKLDFNEFMRKNGHQN